MASSSSIVSFVLSVMILSTIPAVAYGDQLSSTYYSSSCPTALSTIKSAVDAALASEKRMEASLLRLHFHDCFVNGCDGSILLDDTTNFTGEKGANPNANSASGFEVIDTIKSQLESLCPKMFSCADILAVAARDSVVALGGPSWTVELGRRDATAASFNDANRDLPSPGSNLSQLITSFAMKGLTANEMVALSGAHTIGLARNVTDNSTLLPLDIMTPTVFDNNYYKNLVNQKGLLHSDQQLYSSTGGSTDSQVMGYTASSSANFSNDFANAMVKMGSISPLTGTSGEIRTNCRKVN